MNGLIRLTGLLDVGFLMMYPERQNFSTKPRCAAIGIEHHSLKSITAAITKLYQSVIPDRESPTISGKRIRCYILE